MPRSAVLEAAGIERGERGSRAILNIDPPDHTRIRRLAQQAFTPRRVEALDPRVQALVDGMLDAVAPRGEMDVIADLAFPLPFAVISEMLGMPEHDRTELRAWSHTLVEVARADRGARGARRGDPGRGRPHHRARRRRHRVEAAPTRPTTC